MSSGKRPMNNSSNRTAVEKIEVDNKIPLRYYYKIADHLLQEADIHRQMKHIVDLYTVLLKFSSLISETIPLHRDYIPSNQAEKSYYKKKLMLALKELESLKPEVQKRVDGIRNGHTSNGRPQVKKQETVRSGSGASSSDWPNASQNTSLHLEIKLGEANWRPGTSRSPTPPRERRSEQRYQEPGSSSSTNRNISSGSHHVLAANQASVENLVYAPEPSAPPIDSMMDDDGPIPSDLVDANPIYATSSMVEKLNVKAEEEKNGSATCTVCSICYDAPVEGACVPCGHMAGCMSCLNEVKAKNWGCPVCRTKIQLVLRLFAV